MLRRGGLAYRQGKGGPKTVEDHCGKAGRSKVNRLLAKQTRLFSYIEGLQAEMRVYYTLWQCGPELRILVSGEAGPAVRCTFPADMECRARNLLQYLYENAVMPSCWLIAVQWGRLKC